MLRKLLFLLVFAMTSSLGFAQNLQVVSTNPANGAIDVDQDSIEIVFNMPISFNPMDVENSNFDLLIAPQDSIAITSFALRDGGTRLVINATLNDNTDFLGVLTRVEGAQGESLAEPLIFQFTTSAAAGQFVIQGELTGDEMTALKAQNMDGVNGVIAFLTADPFEIEISFGDDEDGDGEDDMDSPANNAEEEDDELSILYATLVDPITGAYTISGIREGEYYATALDLATIDSEEGEGGFPRFYIYDPDMDIMSNAIGIDAGSTTNDTLKNVNLNRVSFDPFTFQEAITRAATVIAGLENNATLVGGATEVPLVGFNSQMQGGIELFVAQNEDPNPPFGLAPDGKNIIWQIFFYDSIRDSALALIVTPVGTLTGDFIGQQEAELPVAFNTLDPLPMTFIDSDSVMKITNAAGGMSFLDAPGDVDTKGVTLEALHSYFDFPPNPTDTAPVMWRVEYERDSFGFLEGSKEDSLVFYVDIVTGDILFKAGNLLEDGDPFSITASTPMEGATSVGTSTEIVFTFDAPLRLDPEGDFEEDGFLGNIFPQDSVEVDSVKLNELGTELRLFVTQSMNTDFTWILSRAKSTSGGDLTGPFVLNYTTSATAGASTVSGTLSESTPAKTQVGIEGSIVALFEENPFTDNDDGDDDMAGKIIMEDGDGDDDNDGPGIDIASATLVAANDGSYTLSGVRDGTYFPLAINLIEDTFDDTPTAIGIYDPDDDGIPNSITVSAGNLTSIDLVYVDFTGITARQGLQTALDSANAIDPSLDLYFILSEADPLFENKENTHGGGAGTPPLSAMATDEELRIPTGSAESFDYVFYSSTSMKGHIISVGQFGVIGSDTLTTDDIDDLDFEGGLGFADITALPATFIDSDSALAVAQANGGSSFLAEDVPFDLVEIEYIVSNATFLIPDEFSIPNTTFFWEVIYVRERFDPITNVFIEDELTIFVNIDGTFIGVDRDSTTPFTAIAGVDAATAAATAIAADNALIFMNGFSVVDRDPELDQQPLPKSKANEPGSNAIDGEFFVIDYRFYSAANTSETAIFVNGNGDTDNNENPFDFLPDDGTTLADLQTIDPMAIIDSDSALAIAEANGGEEFRNDPHPGFDFVRLDISVQAGNFFWEYPAEVPANTIAWRVFYNRKIQNQADGTPDNEMASFLINAATGEIINESIQVSTDDGPEVPTETTLLQNYPNPFNPTTTIPFRINKAQNVEVAIFNLLGQRVATLSNQLFQAGAHTLSWDASRFSSGVYIYQLRTADVIQTKKLTLIK